MIKESLLMKKTMMTGMAVVIISPPAGNADGDQHNATGYYDANLHAYGSR